MSRHAMCDNLRQFMIFSVPSPSSRPLLDFAGVAIIRSSDPSRDEAFLLTVGKLPAYSGAYLLTVVFVCTTQVGSGLMGL